MPTFQRGDQTLYYEDHPAQGLEKGPPVLLLHSFFYDTNMWSEQIKVLPLQGKRVISLDMRGHGQSGDIPNKHTMYDITNDAIGVLDHLNIDKAIWCGLSMGGMQSMRAAIVAPERVAALILMDTDAGPEVLSVKIKYTILKHLVYMFGLKKIRGAASGILFGKTTLKTRKPIVEEWNELMDIQAAKDMKHRQFMVQIALMTRDDVTPKLSKINVPTLIIRGDEDVPFANSHHLRIKKQIKGSKFVVIKKAGHIAPKENPDETNKHVIQFLDSLNQPEEPEQE